MQQDIKKYPIYRLVAGELVRCDIATLEEYNHYAFNLHHYIKQQEYKRNEKWFRDRGIEQKLILLSIPCHEQVHLQAVKNLSDDAFEMAYGISRWELLFNRKHSQYGEMK